MQEKTDTEELIGPLSRRQILIGAASAALVAAVPPALAGTKKAAKRKAPASEAVATQAPVRRYMSASTCLLDGRILITGGFNRPATAEGQPLALSSAVILDPNSGLVT